MTLTTPRLRLHPYTPQQMAALLSGDRLLEKLLGLRAADGFFELYAAAAGDFSQDWLASIASATESNPYLHGFGMIERETNLLIGGCGFKAPPSADGMVEIAYGLIPSREGRGYVTEAAVALVDFALADARVQLVRAHTLPTGAASMRVLEKCGFTNVGQVEDPDDGTVCRWDRPRSLA
jgi:[ribosomal protein S5]-alanine N-acetyltransferase